MLGEANIISAFIAGLLMFLAPCTLPLVPAYLGFMSGVPASELEDPETAKRARRKIFLNGLFFILGFSIVFTIFGTLAGLVGQALIPWRIWLARIGGIFVIFFGLLMLGLFKLKFLQVEYRVKTPSWLTLGRPSSSLLMGGVFAFGWTPCVGPVLGSVLFLAGTTSTILQGGFLLAVFSLGMAIPFLLIALFYSRATLYVENITKYLRVISKIGGVFLLILGILLVTDSFSLVIQLGYHLLEFINYDAIVEYL